MTLAANLKIKVAGRGGRTGGGRWGRQSVACLPAPVRASPSRRRLARPSLPSTSVCFAVPVSRNLLVNFPAEIQCAICNRRGKASERRFSRVAEIANDVVLGARDEPIILSS